MAKKGVIMYYDLLEQLEDFSDEQFGKITRAIIQYDKDGSIPDFDDVGMKVAFKMIKPILDRNKQEYEEICAKRRENGSLGGKQKVANASKSKQKIASVADNDNDNDIDKVNDNVNKKDNIIKEIFTYWNSKDIIKHKELKEDISKSIEKCLKTYTEEQIKTYIDRYNQVIKDKNYFFDYKWTLAEFLSRRDGISAFTDEGSKWVSYINRNKVIGITKNYENRHYSPEELNSLFDSLDDIEI